MSQYASVAELEAQIDLQNPTAATNALLLALLTSASDSIDQYCNRPDGFRALVTATARIYPGSGTGVQWIDECMEVTAVAAKLSPDDATYTPWTSLDWLAATGDPKHPSFNRYPLRFLILNPRGAQGWFPSGTYSWVPGFRPTEPELRDALPFAVPTVQVTARWGYADVNLSTIKQATIIQASRWYKRGQSGWADSLQNADFGTLSFIKELDPDVQYLLKLGRYIKPAIGVLA